MESAFYGNLTQNGIYIKIESTITLSIERGGASGPWESVCSQGPGLAN